MGEAGRPHICTPERIAAIVKAARAGVVLRRLHHHAGVDRSTLARWRAKGKAGEEPFATLLAELEMARAENELDLLAHIKSGEQGWQGAAWIGHRSYGYAADVDEDHGLESAKVVDRESAVRRLKEAGLEGLMAESLGLPSDWRERLKPDDV